MRKKECIWPDTKSRPLAVLAKKRKEKPVPVQLTTEYPNLPISLAVLASLTPISQAADLQAVEDELKIFKEDLTNFQLELDEQKCSELSEQQLAELHMEFQISPQVSTYYLIYSSNLDEEGLRYLDIYRERYSVFILIGLDLLNYFLKTFMALATRNEAILYAVTAWGGFYHELGKPKGNFSKPWLYMQKAAKLMCQHVGDHLRPTNSEDLFVLFAFYLIFIGIEVCTGDVRNWGGFLSQCSQLIESCGGLEKVLLLFNRSNDIKWLISDFQFHDVLSSDALLKGTKFPIEEYKQVLPEDSEYGIDPLQGTVGPIYHLLGEIGNAKVELRKKWGIIEQALESGDKNVNLMRMEYFQHAEELASVFNHKIDGATPWKLHTDLLEQDPQEFELQMRLFELYACVCRMQVATLISQVPPLSVHQQNLLMKSLQLVDFLLPSKVKVALSLLLLICGITCVTDHDRSEMVQRFRKHSNQYEIGNFQRIEELVEEVWARNPKGDICVDWAEIGNEKGWNLYVG